MRYTSINSCRRGRGLLSKILELNNSGWVVNILFCKVNQHATPWRTFGRHQGRHKHYCTSTVKFVFSKVNEILSTSLYTWCIVEWLLRNPKWWLGRIFALLAMGRIRFRSSFSNIFDRIRRRLFGLCEEGVLGGLSCFRLWMMVEYFHKKWK